MIEENRMIVYCENEMFSDDARILSEKTGAKLVTSLPDDINDAIILHYSENGLSISKNGCSFTGDHSELARRLTHSNLSHELLVKAAKIRETDGRRPVLVDATAGMGEDSLLLAARGFRVIMFERDPVIAALLRDTLRRSKNDGMLSEIAGRMELREEDSIKSIPLLTGDDRPDVVLLDPMFPEKSGNALTKKKFQLIHNLEKPCSDEEEILNAAMLAKPVRIVVKRPLKGPYLAGVKPSYSLSGKTVRVDVLVFPENASR